MRKVVQSVKKDVDFDIIIAYFIFTISLLLVISTLLFDRNFRLHVVEFFELAQL